MSLYPVNTTLIIIVALFLAGISSMISSINYCLTCSQSMVISDVFIASIIITSILLILTLPVLSGGLLLILSDMHIGTMFYKGSLNGLSGDSVLYQHLF